MVIRKIFYKKKSNNFFFIKILFFSLILIIFIYYIIPIDSNNFYITPNDKGGEKVKNLDKKSLNLQSEKEFVKILKNEAETYFSIQFYSDNDFKKISEYLDKINQNNESIYNLNDFFILTLNSEIGTDYFLLYKSFKTKQLAKKYCVNYLSKLDQCLIVDTTKF